MDESLSPSEAPVVADMRRLPLSGSIVTGLVSAIDGAAVLLSGGISYAGYLGWNHENQQVYFVAIVLMAALIVSCFRHAKLYDLDVILFFRRSHIGRIAINTGLVVVVLMGLAFACKMSDLLSRVWLVAIYATSLGLICVSRVVIGALLDKRARLGTLTRNVALVGAGEQAKVFVAHFATRNFHWERLVGVFDDRRTRVPCDLGKSQLLGNLNDLIRYVEHGQVDDVIMTLPWTADNRVMEINGKLRGLPVHIYLAFDLVGYRFLGSNQLEYAGASVIEISRAPCSGWKWLVKSMVDRLLSFAILLITAPLLLSIAAMIKVGSSGPVLFRQKRYGFNNQLIEVLKFRTMYHHMRDDEANTLTSRADHRVTPIGRFLRRTSLDELPQLLNVLKGDMSLVGPRPHATKAKANGRLYSEVVARYGSRHRVKPGITGWAQINGWRGETDSEEKVIKRVECDLFYIENWSLWLDIKILVKTTLVAWSQGNAF
jgi:Undecaprenyl-phosphate glucose phosphotransferase